MFEDRHDAGSQLAERLQHYHGGSETVVVAIARGGVRVAVEVARDLELPLDVIVVRRLGHSESSTIPGSRLMANVPKEIMERVKKNEDNDARRRERLYRGPKHTPLDVRGKAVILVDDGIASGISIRAAVEALRAKECRRIIIAVPLCPQELTDDMRALADEFIALATPEPYWNVAAWYEDFSPTTDEEVAALVQQAETDTIFRGQTSPSEPQRPKPH